MNFQGTPGQVRVIVVDPNNIRIGLDTTISTGATIMPGMYNQVTVDSTGRVVSGIFIPPTSPTVTPVPVTNASGIQAKYGDYGGTTPNWNPLGNNIGLAIDTGALGENRVWWYFAGSWH